MRAVRRSSAALLAFGLLLVLAGCFPSREGIYSDVTSSRQEAVARWRTGEAADENLPTLSGDLGLLDAVRMALLHNKQLWSAVEERAKANAQVLSAYGEALPTVDFSAGYTRLDKVPTIDLGGGAVEVGTADYWSYQVDVTQPVFRGGATSAAMRAAQLYRCMSDEMVRQAVQDTVMAVVGAYYGAVLAGHLYTVQEDALAFAEANLHDVTAREEQGVAIRYDRLRAELEVATVRADLIGQRSAMTSAQTSLFRDMGASQRSDVKLTDELAFQPFTPDTDRAVETAFLNRPELYQAELDVRFQEQALRGYKADYLPDVDAWASHTWAKPDPHDTMAVEWGRQWQAGLRLTWTIFDGLRREGRILEQKATLRQSRLKLSDSEQAVLQEVRDAVLALQDAEELVQSQQKNLELANEALRLVQVGAREGVNTELEVLDARRALTQARGLYYQALHSHAMARVGYQRAVGLLGPKPGEGEVPREAPDVSPADEPLPEARSPLVEAGQEAHPS